MNDYSDIIKLLHESRQEKIIQKLWRKSAIKELVLKLESIVKIITEIFIDKNWLLDVLSIQYDKKGSENNFFNASYLRWFGYYLYDYDSTLKFIETRHKARHYYIAMRDKISMGHTLPPELYHKLENITNSLYFQLTHEVFDHIC